MLSWAGITAAFGADPTEADKKAIVLPEPVTEYTLTPGDIIEMRVYMEEDLLTRSPIGIDGTITLPLLGKVNVAGKTVEQVTTNLHGLLQADYLVNPQVNVIVLEYAKKRFSILGHVAKPGTYEMPVDGKFDILAAVSLAGGFNRLASPKKITVQRIKDGKSQVFKVNAEAQIKDFSAPRFLIEPDDTINVGERLF